MNFELKDYIANIAIVIIISAIIYLAFSFAIWDINASNWSSEARIGCIMILASVNWLWWAYREQRKD